MLRRVPIAPILLTIALAAAVLAGVPDLSDPTGGAVPDSVRLAFPALNVVLAPLFDLWDGVSMLPMSRLLAFAGWLTALFAAWRLVAAIRRRQTDPDAGPPIALVREATALGLFLGGFALFVPGGMLWRRPMARLAGAPSDLMVIDVHAHTNRSHDVTGLRRGFDLSASRRWHTRAGFDAFFVTDHNLAGGPGDRPRSGTAPEAIACPGTEVSAWKAHVLLLGATTDVPREPYGRNLENLLRLFHDARQRYGAVPVASIPEYAEKHWDNLAALAAAGAGFEIVNASPKANELRRAQRDSVIAVARATGRLLVAASDHHGWGATSMAWNLVAVPGWRDSPDPCGRLLGVLQRGDHATVQILERHRVRSDAWWPAPLTPIAVVWETWRALNWPRALSWIAWAWLLWWLAATRGERREAALAGVRPPRTRTHAERP